MSWTLIWGHKKPRPQASCSLPKSTNRGLEDALISAAKSSALLKKVADTSMSILHCNNDAHDFKWGQILIKTHERLTLFVGHIKIVANYAENKKTEVSIHLYFSRWKSVSATTAQSSRRPFFANRRQMPKPIPTIQCGIVKAVCCTMLIPVCTISA
jgi:hypothetical protein